MSLLKGIRPQDEIEGMLAVQMTAMHSAALEGLRRAMTPSQTFGGREHSLKHGVKLLGLFAQQMAALDKRRGKGQQKVTVEYVNVEAGGQAIVGNVRLLATELGGIGSSGDLGGAMVRTGVRILLEADGPVETLDRLATHLRQLSGEFPNAWQVVCALHRKATPPGWD